MCSLNVDDWEFARTISQMYFHWSGTFQIYHKENVFVTCKFSILFCWFVKVKKANRRSRLFFRKLTATPSSWNGRTPPRTKVNKDKRCEICYYLISVLTYKLTCLNVSFVDQFWHFASTYTIHTFSLSSGNFILDRVLSYFGMTACCYVREFYRVFQYLHIHS